MSVFRVLPPELIDEILHFVDHDSDLATFSALSLSNKAFLSWCQSRIFSTISFRCTQYGYELRQDDALRLKMKTFLDILYSSPHIAGYVQRLEISIRTGCDDWVTQEPFIQIMETIRQSGNSVKELGLYGISFPEKFGNLMDFERIFLRPFISPFITSLTITGLVGVPFCLLSDSVNLRALAIDHSALQFDFDIDSPRACPRIETISFNPSMGVLESILQHKSTLTTPQILDLSCLRALHTLSLAHNLQAANAIIGISKHRFEELHIKHNEDYTYCPVSGSLDLFKASGLRIIDIEVVFPSCSHVHGDPLADLCGTLNTIPQDNAITEVKLGAYIGFYSQKGGPASSFLADWESVDRTLIRISDGRPLLFHLHMVYCFDEDSDGSSDEEEVETETARRFRMKKLCDQTFRQLVQERLPLVNKSKHVSLKLSQDLVFDQ